MCGELCFAAAACCIPVSKTVLQAAGSVPTLLALSSSYIGAVLTSCAVLAPPRAHSVVLTCSDVGEGAVHHGALLMPLQLSEPTGLCSLQSATDRPTAAAAAAAADGTCSDKHCSKAARARKGPAAGVAGAAAAVAAALVEQEQAAAGSMQPHLRPTQSQPISSSSGAGGGSCVYYGWELLPSGAASPCGAVHSSMLDLFADVAADDAVTSRCDYLGDGSSPVQ